MMNLTNNTYTNMLSLLATTVFISACAPGDSETRASTSTATQASNSIMVASDFTLSSTSEIDIEIVLSSHPNSPAYLSICHEKLNSEPLEIDYENCIIRSSMKSGYFVGSFKLPAHKVTLQAAIWYYDLSIAPIIQAISTDELRSGSIKMSI
jgi:hypothetical protein